MGKDYILNGTTSRFQLNRKSSVGAVMSAIRECKPNNIKEWEKYYYKNVKTKKELIEIGKKLYIKLSEVVIAEIEMITEKDCINYIHDLVINKTYDGYVRETSVYGYLEKKLKVKLYPASDEWDRKYNVDFYIKVSKYRIGIQIKPVLKNFGQSEVFKERNIQLKTHKKFSELYKGKVFYIYSKNIDKNVKEIVNLDVINDLKKEIKELKKLVKKR